MSDDELRDILFPVTLTARQNAYNQGYPLTGFKQLRDQVLTMGHGVHGPGRPLTTPTTSRPTPGTWTP